MRWIKKVSISYSGLLVVFRHDFVILMWCVPYCIEKETYDLFDAADGDYEELEDDFVFIANEGMPLLVPQEDDKDQTGQDSKSTKDKKGKKVTFGFS